MSVNELYGTLPGSWKELKLKDYQKLMDIVISENDKLNIWVGVDNTLQVINRLTGISVVELEELSYSDVAALAHKISFFKTLPERDKRFEVKFKRIEDISYDSFITYIKALENKDLNLKPMFKAVAKDLTEEQIDNLNMEEVLQGFFLLRKHLKKFTSNLIWSSRLKLMKKILERKNKQQPSRLKTNS